METQDLALHTILLIVDNPTVGAIVREELVTAGYRVEWARNTLEAHAMWAPSEYDVVLVDLRKDSDHGAGFVDLIKATSPGQRVAYLNNGHRTGTGHRNGKQEKAKTEAKSIKGSTRRK